MQQSADNTIHDSLGGPRSSNPPDSATGLNGVVLGIGMTMIEISRVRRILEQRPASLARWFAPDELACARWSARSSEDFAGRIACKLAVRKAWAAAAHPQAHLLDLRDVLLTKDDRGKPIATIAPSPAWKLTARVKRPWTLDVSVTHSRDLAAAVAVVGTRGTEQPPPPERVD